MQSLNAIPLSALRAIEAIARTGTLARAADELGVTAGALSQRLAKAEEALGQTLFQRTSTGLKPTERCAEIIPYLSRGLRDLSEAVAILRTPERTNLTVSVAPLFARRWLIWRIQKFNQMNPAISLRILPTVEVVDLDHSDVDIGIRVGDNPALGEGATKLLDQRVFPVCSPDLARNIHSLNDLLALPVIREDERLYGWTVWLAEHGIADPELKNGPTYADASLCLDAAMMGQGVFMAWETLACDALERGQIVAPFSQRSATGSTYWFATSQHSARNPNVRLFKEWLIAELAASVRDWTGQTGAP